MRRFLYLVGITALSVSFVLISCKKDENKDAVSNTCNVSNPVEELAWLKESIDQVKQDEYSYYMMAKYKNETVFYYGNCNPLTHIAANFEKKQKNMTESRVFINN